MTNFIDYGLNDEILMSLNELGFNKPTPIQSEVIPNLISSNQDIIATAQTGTGKTGAFGIPVIHLNDNNINKTQTLVMCPTRELCIQITNDLLAFAKNIANIKIIAIYGGASIENQIKGLKKGSHIIIGTPGRTKDLIKRKKIHLSNIRRIILDEADEMLTMGFKDDLEHILSKTPNNKQTLLFSATMSKKIISITNNYMNNPLMISIARVNLGADNLEHKYYVVNRKDKYEAVKRISDSNPGIYAICFCRTRRETKDISSKLIQDGYNADAIHGDLSQAQRDEVMKKFRLNNLNILVATDVAARGLDVNNLTHIINYNLPDDEEVYIHRSGRTGRAGKSGISVAIINKNEIRKIRSIEKISKINFKKDKVPDGRYICEQQLYALIKKISQAKIDSAEIEPFLKTIYNEFEGISRQELIKSFISVEFNKFLSCYKKSKDINISDKNVKVQKNSIKISKNKRRKSNFTTFSINLGKNDKLNASRLIGIINQNLNSKDFVIGKINVMKKNSTLEIESQKTSSFMKSLKKKKINGKKISIRIIENNFKSKQKNKKTHKKKKI